MYVKVNRRLLSGLYHVSFEVAGFTPEEVQKMGSFGIPQIELCFGGSGSSSLLNHGLIPLNKITKAYDAAYTNEDDAKKYEESVLSQIRGAVEFLRKSEDKFTSSEEVNL